MVKIIDNARKKFSKIWLLIKFVGEKNQRLPKQKAAGICGIILMAILRVKTNGDTSLFYLTKYKIKFCPGDRNHDNR